jgi:L-fuculokinase
MNRIPVIAIFDVGKTNKKLFFFDEQYKIVFEQQANFREIQDEDGDPCEDLDQLIHWVKNTLDLSFKNALFDIKAINFCAYGASFIHLDSEGKPLTPLYNYLKDYPAYLSRDFYQAYGGTVTFSMLTASPVLGSLNSGMQLYRIKKKQPEIFNQIKYSLHLPQFLAFLISGKYYSDMTSIGCHTNLWNFPQHHYHEWVYREGIVGKLAPIVPSNHSEELNLSGRSIHVGVGLHDSSSALIPYLESFREPFILISTGTWCINLNPFNSKPLSIGELQEDCLCYLSFRGNPVKASRIFAGYQHEQEARRISAHFSKPENYYTTVLYNHEIIDSLRKINTKDIPGRSPGDSLFHQRDLSTFQNYEEAYHQLMLDIIRDQTHALHLILDGTDVKRIFVDGGFSKNLLYMHLLAESLNKIEVFAASVPQATAMGAALAIHEAWNNRTLPNDIIDLRLYATTHPTIFK